MNDDGILFRLWTHPDGRVDTLIFIEEEPFAALLRKVHGFLRQSGAFGISHAGQRKTMLALSRVFFAFGMRKKIHDFVNSCSVCQLNTNPVSSAEKSGAMIDTEVMSTLVCDYLGPLHGWALTAAGKPRYVFLGVDMTSDYTFTNVSNTCNDDATLEALKKIRNILGGLPR